MDVESDLVKFEKDVLYEFEKTEGTSLWENVISSLNEDARTLVTESRMPSRKISLVDQSYTQTEEIILKCDTSISINVSGEEEQNIPETGLKLNSQKFSKN